MTKSMPSPKILGVTYHARVLDLPQVRPNLDDHLEFRVSRVAERDYLPAGVQLDVELTFVGPSRTGTGPEPSPPPTEYQRELKQLLLDWIDKSLSDISEYGSSSGDWPPLIEDAHRRARILGIPWTSDEMPDYVKEMLAIRDDD